MFLLSPVGHANSDGLVASCLGEATSWFHQNFHTLWYPTIQSDGVIALPAADSKTTFIDARDIGEAAALASYPARRNDLSVS